MKIASLLILFLTLHGNCAPAMAEAQPPSSEAEKLEQKIFLLINEYRGSLHLAPLVLNPLLIQQARLHSHEMSASLVPFGHEGLEQRRSLIAQSLSGETIAENVAFYSSGPDCAKKIVENWLKSPPHRKNIEGAYSFTGIGVEKKSNGTDYVTQIFWG
jgi:uncharacterized protein YkwD